MIKSKPCFCVEYPTIQKEPFVKRADCPKHGCASERERARNIIKHTRHICGTKHKEVLDYLLTYFPEEPSRDFPLRGYNETFNVDNSK